MKIVHYINFALITLFLIAICILEEVTVSTSLRQTQEDCFLIEASVDRLDSVKNMEIAIMVDNLEYDWKQNESNMCYLVNHKSVQEIGQEIAKLKLYIASDDVANFKVSIEVIKFYCHSYLHFMGANIHNVL